MKDLYVSCDLSGKITMSETPIKDLVVLMRGKESQREEISKVLYAIATLATDNVSFIVPDLRNIHMGLGGSPFCAETDPVEAARSFSNQLKERFDGGDVE